MTRLFRLNNKNQYFHRCNVKNISFAVIRARKYTSTIMSNSQDRDSTDPWFLHMGSRNTWVLASPRPRRHQENIANRMTISGKL
ncbi:hypothetical protein GWI33_002470 [Rhynchophorus ferrugineus]|uniref:Uncharacterized protein n=1 Tax=Rhynchophorus ferrugineus TaxID=354439 RepID=A0A834IVA1_RHYFE|nr:hypothetical protein GWI33_002470 [Rhynchophorus ferrugineus]